MHGVNPTGKDSLDLVRISEALAQVGYRVFVPDFVEMKKVHLQPEEALRMKFIEQIRAPLILVHGVNDPVIPAQQSVELLNLRAHVE